MAEDPGFPVFTRDLADSVARRGGRNVHLADSVARRGGRNVHLAVLGGYG